MREQSTLTPVGRLNLVPLFPGLHRELMTLLRGLQPADWLHPTACAMWSVKDIVAHLLDTCLRRLSFDRDRLQSGGPFSFRDGINDRLAPASLRGGAVVGVPRELSGPIADGDQRRELVQLRGEGRMKALIGAVTQNPFA